MNELQLRAAAVAVGAQTYTQGPMRAVTGLSFTYAQLAEFASAVAADERGTFAQTAAQMNRVTTDFAVHCERERCCLIVATLLGADTPQTRMVQNAIREVQCSSLCHTFEPCMLTEDGRCDVQKAKP